MTRVAMIEPDTNSDPQISEILAWVTEVEGAFLTILKLNLISLN